MSSVTSVNATPPLTSSGGTTPTISTSIATNKLLGRSTAGTGVAEEISISGLTLSAGTLTIATGVTSVGATPPLASSGGTTPDISITQASGSTDGFLSSTDWTTFNGKVSSVSGSSPIVSSGGTNPIISITQASGSTNGFLSSTDWTTFNNKPSNNQIVSGYQGLGSSVKAVPIGVSFLSNNAANVLDFTNRRVVLSPVYLSTTTNITGVKWYQSVRGDGYTTDNYNGVGLYSVSGNNLTLIGSSIDDGNIWKTFASSTWGNKEFSSPIPNLAAGTYYVATLLNYDPLAPVNVIPGLQTWRIATAQYAPLQAFDFTGGKFSAFFDNSPAGGFPLNKTISTTSALQEYYWLSLY
jgi:hypothetical protein